MNLPVMPPVKPMLAKAVSILPDGMRYEPKWDGFRCLIFRDGDEVELISRNLRPMNRYFPELVAAARQQLPERCVLDGEIVVIVDGPKPSGLPGDAADADAAHADDPGDAADPIAESADDSIAESAAESGIGLSPGAHLDFETLQLRIHPATSRVDLLAAQTPASFVAYDLLALGDESLMDAPFAERRRRLARILATADGPMYCTPVTESRRVAERWFRTFEGAGLDGVIAKPPDVTYQPDKRVMFKVKHDRTADCVVAGFRWHKTGPVIGSLVLGLYDEHGKLHHVGVAASFPMARRKSLVEELEPYRLQPGEPHPWLQEGVTERIPGGVQSRWNAKKDLSWEGLRPELVVEVGYDAMEGSRFRHTAQFRRWRHDRDPVSCTYEQLERPVTFDLGEVLAAGRAETTARDVRRG